MSCLIIKNDSRHSKLIEEYLREKDINGIHIANGDITELKKEMSFRAFHYAIIDFHLEERCGFEVARTIKRHSLATRCVICIDPEDFKPDYLIHYDINGYLSVNHSLTELVQCFEVLNDGYRYMCTEICNKLSAIEHTKEDLCEDVHLTSQEKKILRLLVSGKNAYEIAEQLFLSINTINNHKTKIRNKLHLKSNRQLIFYAMNHVGIIS